ncbi:ABC transporter ATP-binding protein [Catellatospora sp. KI3]|uniref:ABC transporter ATP-binding protein n=1 Tax=Catellatospora sp. KI3 TaxID=3041620 RepID=UPI0024831B70|nr:ABC transporter ATP-binding protein [Catellatospora sp. KI3]MDI1461645.1 ABC transporter ATP-binding protein [Catellatospora sp. KI3]
MSDVFTAAVLPIASARDSRRYLSAALRERWPGLAGALAAGAVGAAAGVATVYTLGVLVDRVREGAAVGVVAGVAAVLVGCAVLGGLATGLGTYLTGRLGASVLAELRERVLARVLRLPSAMVEGAGQGDLLSRVGSDATTIGKAVADVIPTMASSVLLGTLSLLAMAGLDWRLGLAGAVAVPLYVLALRWYLPRSSPVYARERLAGAQSSQHLVESLHGVRTVHAYRLLGWRMRGLEAASAARRDLSVSVFTLFTRFVGRVNRAEFLVLSAILVTGFLLVRDGSLTVGETAAAAVLFHRLFNPIGMLLFVFDEVQLAGASLARLVGVVDIPETEEPVAAQEPADASVELVDVVFGYSPGVPVLHGVTLRLAPGERVALVGTTGAGKSTLAAIAAGVLRPDSGAALAGGAPLPKLGPLLRRHIAMVTQETRVFAGPLAADLRLAKPGAADDELRAALSVVDALDWVDALPDGLATAVGEGGHPLTAAQAQQVALARLVLAEPAVVVLDEATAEAGSQGARVLEEAASAAMRGRTALIVAHRLTQAAAADRVCVLEDGRIVEEGHHDELLKADGYYAGLWRAWQARTPTSTETKVRLT